MPSIDRNILSNTILEIMQVSRGESSDSDTSLRLEIAIFQSWGIEDMEPTWAKAPILKEELIAVSELPFNFKCSKKSTGKPCASHRSLAMSRALIMIKSKSDRDLPRDSVCGKFRVWVSVSFRYLFRKKKSDRMVSRALLSRVLRSVCQCRFS